MDVYAISDFEAFADAAEEFHPHIKFYATFNPKVSDYSVYDMTWPQKHVVWPESSSLLDVFKTLTKQYSSLDQIHETES